MPRQIHVPMEWQKFMQIINRQRGFKQMPDKPEK